MISETLEKSHKRIISSFRKNEPIIVLFSLTFIIASLSNYVKLTDISGFAIAASICFFISLISSFLLEFAERNLYITSFFFSSIILGILFLFVTIGFFIIGIWMGSIAFHLIVIIAIVLALSILCKSSIGYTISMYRAGPNANITDKKVYASVVASTILPEATVIYFIGHAGIIYSLLTNTSFLIYSIRFVYISVVILFFGSLFYVASYKMR